MQTLLTVAQAFFKVQNYVLLCRYGVLELLHLHAFLDKLLIQHDFHVLHLLNVLVQNQNFIRVDFCLLSCELEIHLQLLMAFHDSTVFIQQAFIFQLQHLNLISQPGFDSR